MGPGLRQDDSWRYCTRLTGRQRTPLPLRPSDHRHQLRDLLALVGFVAARDCVLDAMGDVVLQNLFLDPAQRGAHRRDLRHDVDAVAILLCLLYTSDAADE